MKHFLPRVLELVSGFEYPCHSTEITFTRLDLDQPARWEPAETALLQDFAQAFFRHCLTLYPLPGGDRLSDLVVMFGIAHFNLAPLLAAWATAGSRPALRHFADLLVDELEDWYPRPPKLRNAFSTKPVDAAVVAWLRREDVKAGFVAQLENAVLSDPALDEETRSRFSWAYEVARML